MSGDGELPILLRDRGSDVIQALLARGMLKGVQVTCIIGLEHEGKVYIGADSGAALDWTVRQTRLPKVFRRGPFLIGYTTSFRMGQILQHHLTVEPQDGEDDDAYMVSRFVEAVRKCLKERGFAKIDNNVEEGGRFLVGYKDRLYYVGSDFQVNSVADGYDACGCGKDFALGAIRVLDDLAPKARIRQAMEAAMHFCGALCKPFVCDQAGGWLGCGIERLRQADLGRCEMADDQIVGADAYDADDDPFMYVKREAALDDVRAKLFAGIDAIPPGGEWWRSSTQEEFRRAGLMMLEAGMDVAVIVDLLTGLYHGIASEFGA